jgi:transcriptional regulator with XRE-family HTH domain
MSKTAKLPSRESLQLAFGAAVKTLREGRQLTQEGLAEAADVHFTYVSSVERGKRNISLFNVHRLAHALGVSASELFLAAELQSRSR